MLNWRSYWKINPARMTSSEPRQPCRLRVGMAMQLLIIEWMGMICCHSRREVVLRSVGRL